MEFSCPQIFLHKSPQNCSYPKSRSTGLFIVAVIYFWEAISRLLSKWMVALTYNEVILRKFVCYNKSLSISVHNIMPKVNSAVCNKTKGQYIRFPFFRWSLVVLSIFFCSKLPCFVSFCLVCRKKMYSYDFIFLCEVYFRNFESSLSFVRNIVNWLLFGKMSSFLWWICS